MGSPVRRRVLFFSVINFYELKFMSIMASSFHGMLKQLINSGGGSGA